MIFILTLPGVPITSGKQNQCIFQKKNSVKKTGLLFLLFAIVLLKSVSAQTDSSHLRISLLTCSPGEELYSTFGHTALRIVDSIKQTDIVYNYGTFDFDDPDFYMKFTRGKLDYFLSVQSLPEFLYEYLAEKRDVIEQELRLPGNAKLSIAKALSENMMGANRYYKYDFLYNNCTTRIRDILSKYAGLTVTKLLVPKNTTFRNMLHEYLDKGGEPWSKLGIDLLLGSPIDKKATIDQSMFLPEYLMKGIDSSSPGIIKNRSLINSGTQVTPRNNYWPVYLFSAYCLVMIALSFLQNKFAGYVIRLTDFLLLSVTGLIGFLLLFMWFGTNHKACGGNYNLLWALPTNLFAALVLWKKPKWIGKYFTFCSVWYSLLLITWFWLPQQLNFAFIPIAFLLLFRTVQLRKV